jgi:hypothetical protein
MNNKFKIHQISTDQFVLTRQNRHSTEYITNELNVVVLDSVGSNNNVVYSSLNVARQVLQTYNSKQLLSEVRSDDKGLSIKFKYKVDEDGSESTIYTINTGGFEEVIEVNNNEFNRAM